jgi:hypothetical protein
MDDSKTFTNHRIDVLEQAIDRCDRATRDRARHDAVTGPQHVAIARQLLPERLEIRLCVVPFDDDVMNSRTHTRIKRTLE